MNCPKRILSLLTLFISLSLSAAWQTDLPALYEQADAHINEAVELRAMQIGVCSHGGKKAFFKSEDGQSATFRVEVVHGGKSFERAHNGDTVIVRGVLRELRIDDAYLNQWEAEATAATHEHESTSGFCEGACATGKEETPTLKRIAQLRRQLAESGEAYLSSIWVDATDWEVIEE